MHIEPEWPELEEPEESNGQDVELPPTDVEPIWKEETELLPQDTQESWEQEPLHIEEEFTSLTEVETQELPLVEDGHQAIADKPMHGEQTCTDKWSEEPHGEETLWPEMPEEEEPKD